MKSKSKKIIEQAGEQKAQEGNVDLISQTAQGNVNTSVSDVSVSNIVETTVNGNDALSLSSEALNNSLSNGNFNIGQAASILETQLKEMFSKGQPVEKLPKELQSLAEKTADVIEKGLNILPETKGNVIISHISTVASEAKDAFQSSKISNITDSLFNFLSQQETFATLLYFIFVYVFYKASLKLTNSWSNFKEKKKQQKIDRSESLKQQIEFNETVKVSKNKVRQISFRNLFFLLAVIGAVIIWKDSIKSAFLSISFAIMGLVILFRDVLVNVLASIVISVTKSFNILDSIEVKGVRGVILDRTFFNTTIAIEDEKTGLQTGRYFKIPNSYFLSNDVSLLTRMGLYTNVFINIVIKDDDRNDVLNCRADLEEAVNRVVMTERNKMVYEKIQTKWKKDGNLDAFDYKPFVTIDASCKEMKIVARVCLDKRNQAAIQQRIVVLYHELKIKREELKKQQKFQEKQCREMLEGKSAGLLILNRREVKEMYKQLTSEFDKKLNAKN